MRWLFFFSSGTSERRGTAAAPDALAGWPKRFGRPLERGRLAVVRLPPRQTLLRNAEDTERTRGAARVPEWHERVQQLLRRVSKQTTAASRTLLEVSQAPWRQRSKEKSSVQSKMSFSTWISRYVCKCSARCHADNAHVCGFPPELTPAVSLQVVASLLDEISKKKSPKREILNKFKQRVLLSKAKDGRKLDGEALHSIYRLILPEARRTHKSFTAFLSRTRVLSTLALCA